MATLESIAADIAEIKNLLRAGAGSVIGRPAYENPPVTADTAVIDGQTINPDGSIWVYDDTGHWGPPGERVAVRLCYGYFSQAKDPELYEQLVSLFGQSFLDWYAARDPWAIYKADIKGMVSAGAINWINFMWLMQPYSRHVQ